MLQLKNKSRLLEDAKRWRQCDFHQTFVVTHRESWPCDPLLHLAVAFGTSGSGHVLQPASAAVPHRHPAPWSVPGMEETGDAEPES